MVVAKLGFDKLGKNNKTKTMNVLTAHATYSLHCVVLCCCCIVQLLSSV